MLLARAVRWLAHASGLTRRRRPPKPPKPLHLMTAGEFDAWVSGLTAEEVAALERQTEERPQLVPDCPPRDPLLRLWFCVWLCLLAAFYLGWNTGVIDGEETGVRYGAMAAFRALDIEDPDKAADIALNIDRPLRDRESQWAAESILGTLLFLGAGALFVSGVIAVVTGLVPPAED